MANKRFCPGMLAMALIFGMTLIGCNDGSGDEEQGSFVLTDIPKAYNGKYAYLEGVKGDMELLGCHDYWETETLVKIISGEVSLPLWLFPEGDAAGRRYSGNDTFTFDKDEFVAVIICDTAAGDGEVLEIQYFQSVAFKNGNATKSWNDGYGEGEGGSFVLTDIPAKYNGKYACLEGIKEETGIGIIGYQKINIATETFTLAKIANGKVIIPLWLYSDDNSSVYSLWYDYGVLSRYSGNDTFTFDKDEFVAVIICDTETDVYGEELEIRYFQSVAFKNGNATKSWNDGFTFTTYCVGADDCFCDFLDADVCDCENCETASGNGPGVPSTPRAPAGVTATALSSSSISVSWSAVSGATSYDVYYEIGLSSTKNFAGNVTGTSYTHTGLQPSTTYYYYIKAKNSAGESGYSSYSYTSYATTQSSSGGISVPSAPTGVTATALSSSSISVSWSAVSGAASYDVYYEIGSSTTKNFAGNVTGTSYTHTGLQPNTTYWYYIKAKNSAGESGYSTLRFATTSAATAATKTITQFRFADFSVNGTINGPNITVTVPNIVNLTTLVPTIVHNGKSISPASGVAQNFSSPIQYTVTANDNTTQNYTVTVTVTNTSLATAFTWINSYSGSTRDFTIVAQANASIAPITIDPYSSSTNIILSGGTTEKTISLNANGSLFTISYGTLTLGNNITLQGRSSNNASLVKLNYSSANLVMNSGSKIINNTVTINDNYARGGAVNVDYGTFTMNGGTISGNRVEATSSSSSYSSTYVRAIGGGVYVDGTFIMNNGTISDNTAYSNKFPSAGGGVFVDNYGTFTMKNGTISDNTAQSSSVLATSYTYGGGVAAWTSGTFTMQGGTISGNTVTSADNRLGGGVYAGNSYFTKTGGTIYGSNASSLQNTAKDTNSGHAVYASVNSTILRRNTTAGTSVNMDSSRTGSAGGWE